MIHILTMFIYKNIIRIQITMRPTASSLYKTSKITPLSFIYSLSFYPVLYFNNKLLRLSTVLNLHIYNSQKCIMRYSFKQYITVIYFKACSITVLGRKKRRVWVVPVNLLYFKINS